MHIRNAEDYEAALEDAAQRMDAGSRGREADPSLFELLAAIQAYSPILEAAPDGVPALAGRAESLVSRARDLQRLYEEHGPAPWNHAPTDGGLGPTTGA